MVIEMKPIHHGPALRLKRRRTELHLSQREIETELSILDTILTKPITPRGKDAVLQTIEELKTQLRKLPEGTKCQTT